MTTPRRRPSASELRVLDLLWSTGESTVRALAEASYGEPTSVQYRTVQVQLDRLEKKGFVERDRSANPHRFAAATDRARFIGEQLQHMAEEVCDGSLTPLLISLVQNAELSEGEKRELWQLLQDDGLEGNP